MFTGVMDIIGYLFPIFIFKYFNRTQTQLVILSVMLFSVCLALIFDSNYSETVTSLMRWTGKLLASGMYSVIYVHTPEMFPTAVRGQCLAFPDGISKLVSAVHKDSIVCAVTSNIRYPRRDDTRGCQLGANVGRVHLL